MLLTREGCDSKDPANFPNDHSRSPAAMGDWRPVSAADEQRSPAFLRSRTPSPSGSPRPHLDSKNSKHVPASNAPASNAPAYMKAVMKFDGIAQSITAPQPCVNLGGSAGLTVTAWVKRSKQSAAYDRLIDFGNGEEKENIVINFQQTTMYEVHCGGETHVLAAGGDSKHPAVFPRDRWTHVALVHDVDGTASIFWDGSLKARGHVKLPPPVHRENYYVGRSHWSHDPYFQGEISDVHVFNYALSSDEVERCCFARNLPSGSC